MKDIKNGVACDESSLEEVVGGSFLKNFVTGGWTRVMEPQKTMSGFVCPTCSQIMGYKDNVQNFKMYQCTKCAAKMYLSMDGTWFTDV